MDSDYISTVRVTKCMIDQLELDLSELVVKKGIKGQVRIGDDGVGPTTSCMEIVTVLHV